MAFVQCATFAIVCDQPKCQTRHEHDTPQDAVREALLFGWKADKRGWHCPHCVKEAEALAKSIADANDAVHDCFATDEDIQILTKED